jgi:hypothetical protein
MAWRHKKRAYDATTILIMTLLITNLLEMTSLKTLNVGYIAYNDITFDINKCNITYVFIYCYK